MDHQQSVTTPLMHCLLAADVPPGDTAVERVAGRQGRRVAEDRSGVRGAEERGAARAVE